MDVESLRKKLVVLTVEPGETSLSTRKLLVESVGFNALSAVTGGQALELVAEHPVHAALLDNDITDIPVGELISRLRRQFPKLPVFIFSRGGWVEPEVRDQISGVFEKMADPKVMVEELSNVLSMRSDTAA